MGSPFLLVTATMADEPMFWQSRYLGRSLRRIPEPIRPDLQVFFSNEGEKVRGLPTLYNEVIRSSPPERLLIFCHDDVYLNDWYLTARVSEALAGFDVIGVAGSVNPDLSQPSWGLKFDDRLNFLGWQDNLQGSGGVNHFDYACPNFVPYGPSPAAVKLLDGVFLAAKAGTLQSRDVYFDERFSFHMYDLDFCRTAVEAGLQLGTWPISLTHDSGGGFDSLAFRKAAAKYLRKWSGVGPTR